MNAKTSTPAPGVNSNGAAYSPGSSATKDLPVMTLEKAEAILAAAKQLSENSLFDEYIRAVEEYRKVHNTVPDAD